MSTETDVEKAEKANGKGAEQQEEQTFTQADLDRVVAERLAREREKFKDYDELKAKAEGAKTLEDRVGTLEGELKTSQSEALRSRIAADFGISTKKGEKNEPSDAELFLTGSDEATLTAQAKRLVAREADRKKQGNVAPNEGESKSEGVVDSELREFAGQLFGNTD